MPVEIEHKFLLANDNWRQCISRSEQFKQGYLSSQPTSSIRVRISGNQAWLNIKSATIGMQRLEFEYEIPITDGHDLLNYLCAPPFIEKTRHYISAGPLVWEIDEFNGANQGLIVAEIELSYEGQPFTKPDWLGPEVTHDVRYYNNNLARKPYSTW
jgi:adenylate cyclase